LLLTTITLLFGISINSITGQTEIDMMMELRDDPYKDPWIYDPSVIVWGEHWRYWCIAGYYGSLAVFSYAWFEYMKDEKYNNKEYKNKLKIIKEIIDAKYNFEKNNYDLNVIDEFYEEEIKKYHLETLREQDNEK